MEEKTNTCRVLLGISEIKRPFGRPRCIILKWNLKQ